MFIDDLQWADSASLNFIKMLMTNKSIQNLLIIGTYGDEKMNLLQDTLASSRKDILALEELLEFIYNYNKTGGNPFFVKQSLQSLYEKEYIWFNYDLMQWCWDISQIRKMDITENVIELLIKRINTLNNSTRENLIYAACIGNLFDLGTLALINNKPMDSVLENLHMAVNEGLIYAVRNKSMDLLQSNIKFRFLHDRIQQAAYSLISDEMRQVTHLNIGRLLLKKYSYSPKTEQLFEIVRQFNEGKSIISDRSEYINLAELNFKAGMAAKSSSAFKEAFTYFQTGIQMLSNNAWQEYYDLTLQLYSEIAEMSYLISDFVMMNRFAETVLQNAKTLTDKVKVYNIKIQTYQAQLNLQEALKTGISVLELMGINMPIKPNQTDIEKSFDNVKEAMKGMEVDDLLNLPLMSEPVKLAAMEIMLSTMSATYKAAPILTPMLACKTVEFYIKYGNAPLSAGAYTFYGLLLCTIMKDIEQGYRFGEMSIKMLERKNLNQYKAIVLDMNSYCIKHWKEHLKSTLDPFIEGFRIENGNFENAACCLAGHAKKSFYLGNSLKILEEEIGANIKIIEKTKKCSSLYYERIFGQLVLNIQGKAKNSLVLTGETCDENKILSAFRSAGDMLGIFFMFLSKTILYYHFGEYSLAVETLKKAEEKLNEKQTTITTLELIDINTIMKASQAISQEIVLDELIKKLIDIVIENVGAQKVVFIMKEADHFIIKGKKEIEDEKITVVQDTKIEQYEDIPKSIINYVSRKNESVILDNSINSINFGGDKYIVKRKPKSVLCFPLINQRELKGIIYLENNLMTGAFTRDRFKVLEILSSQIVISLENANLYEGLERSNEILDTKVKERTNQLKEERDKLQKYLDIAQVSFLVLDKDEKISLINRKGCEILGYNEEELLGKKWDEKFIRNEDEEELKNKFDISINGELVKHLDSVIVTKTGEERMMSTHNVVLIDKEGNFEGTLSCGVDVTEDNLLREQLEYNKLKLEIFANLSHELKTPLNLSFCALQMLNLYRDNNVKSEVNEKLDRYANVIKQNNYRLLRLVNNIVDITKINANSFDLIMQNHDIVEFIRNITYSVSDYVENKNRILEFNSNIRSKVITCDPFSIERILLNLLSNAIKFTDEGDEISVSIYDKEDSISIVVKDTGIGISKDKQKIIFERFRQVDKSFTRNSEGSGIGLTIVKLLIELHQGDIKVESQAGVFTEFIIDLPIRKLEENFIPINNYNSAGNSLIDRIDIEFSDVYGL